MFLFLALQKFCSTKRNRLCYCGRGLNEEHLCELISKLDRWFRSWLKTFLVVQEDMSFKGFS